MARAKPSGIVDLRGHDWARADIADFGQREADKFARAIKALEDPRVADATYRLANFGDAMSVSSWERMPEASWLMVAYQAAIALDLLPD